MSSENKGLSLIKRAAQMLAEATTLQEFKAVRDVGEAAIRFAKSRRDVGIEAVQQAQEIVRRAERDMGLMLPDVTGGRGRKEKSHDVTFLSDLGIERMQSSRFQKIAQLPDEEFEAWVSSCRDSGEELTQAAALRLAAEFLADPIETPQRELCIVVSEAFRSVYAKYSPKLDGDSRAYVIERLETLLELLKQEGSEYGSRRIGAKSTRTKAAAG